MGGGPEAQARRIDPSFRPLLSTHDLEDLEHPQATVFGMWRDGRLAYLSPSWFAFARANNGEATLGAWGLGANVLDATPSPLQRFFRDGYERCARSGRHWSHDYECPSPSRARQFRMQVYPLDKGRGLLVVNALVTETPHPDPGPSATPAPGDYLDGKALIPQCCHCRRVKHRSGRWDWVPQWVARPRPEMTGGLCGPCMAHYYPATAAR